MVYCLHILSSTDMLPPAIVSDMLKQHLSWDDKKIADLAERAQAANTGMDELIVEDGLMDEVTLYAKAGDAMGVPFVALKEKDIPDETLGLIPPEMAEAHMVVAFAAGERDVSIAMADPTDIQTIEFLRRKIGKTPTPHLATPSDIKTIIRKMRHADIEEHIERGVQASQADDETAADTADLHKAASELSTVSLMTTILEHAVYESASDIHIEPAEKEIHVRYRVDGVLKTAMTLPKRMQSAVVARVKVLSELKIDEHMAPQDGRFTMTVGDEALSFRVSIMPVYDGEKIVMRILHEGEKTLTLDDLGLFTEAKAIVERAIEKPHGMVLVTGPTGSGKTTTLYTILNMLNEPGVNICTIEDPIEYHVPNINQSQINPRTGFTFATGLRAFLRQDPDIIMVGEIRDQETAEIAIHAAMTGHLVLSTLHTNDAPTTIPRLIDMGVPPFLVAFTLSTIAAQRLVRKICPHCVKEYHLEEKEIDELGKIANIERMMELFKAHGVALSAEEKTFKAMTFSRGEGCARCNKSGYKGRIGIYEVLEVTPELSKKINERANVDEVKAYASDHGMITLLEDGLLKAKQGITTIEEVLRATRD